MATVNAVLRPVFDLVQGPLAGLPALVGIVLWSIPVSVFALWAFKRFSNQQRIAEVKKRIAACLFEIRLFNDDLRAIARAQGEILRHVLHYQGLALVPMVVILPPLVLVMVQLHAFYGFAGLTPGDEVLVNVTLSNVADRQPAAVPAPRPPVDLVVPAGLHLDGPGVWARELGEMTWRLVADAPGDYLLEVTAAGASYPKSVKVTDRLERLSPLRPDRTFLEQLEWPSEPPLPDDAPVRAISVAYPDATLDVLGWGWHWRYAWMVVFFVLTMVVALALKNAMGVTL